MDNNNPKKTFRSVPTDTGNDNLMTEERNNTVEGPVIRRRIGKEKKRSRDVSVQIEEQMGVRE